MKNFKYINQNVKKYSTKIYIIVKKQKHTCDKHWITIQEREIILRTVAICALYEK